MKNAAGLLIAFLVCSLIIAQRPGPPGLDQGERTVQRGESNVPPPLVRYPRIDPVKLKHDADELATLAQTIPSSVEQINKGVMQQDLPERLKKIEKLAKRLRSQISQ